MLYGDFAIFGWFDNNDIKIKFVVFNVFCVLFIDVKLDFKVGAFRVDMIVR